MTNQKLGRGLSALLGESKSELNIKQAKEQKILENLDIDKIIAGTYQPRINFKEEAIHELANSIEENGLIQPIIVRKIDRDEDKYEIIAGERRFRACKILNYKKIPVIIKKINNHEALEMAIIENVQRQDLSVIEEAEGYKRLMIEFSYSQDEIAKRVGKSRSHIANLIRLLNLPKKVQDLINNNEISMGHARAIINSKNPEKLAKKIINESLSVRDVEDLTREEKYIESKNTPAFFRTESSVKFVSNDYLKKYEKRLSELLNMDAKISYNSNKDRGRITLKFEDFDKLSWLVADLQKISRETITE